ncbi:MAG TPA: hypothetical protein VNZ49_02080 [Bacteroidia bacterium]|jgi:hypothetical protein|nr:hypothetical protein [Bacteroidia bacterium]
MTQSNLTYTPNMAIVLLPKAPFIEWQNVLSTKGLFSVKDRDPSVYLLPEHYRIPSEVEDDLKNIYLPLFINELNQVANDAISQPRDKPFEMFVEWFEVKVVMDVWKLEDGK